MQFSSITFLLFFLPVLLFVLFFLRREAHNAFLLIASLVFYFWGEYHFFLLFLCLLVSNYLLGLLLGYCRTDRRRKQILILGVVANLLPLLLFKYSGFFVANLNVLLRACGGGHLAIPAPQLPLGLSFITFQLLSFLMDVYRRQDPGEKNLLRFALYLALFPKLITGPITPFRELAPQIRWRSISAEDFNEGARRFILGLAKKVLLADTMARVANPIFSIPAAQLTAGLAWLGMVAYALQIFFDFSGYSDMAIAVGRMLGFRLPENFRFPYAARSIREFWTRWHISLANWLRDYLFLPIAYAVSRRIKTDRLLGIRAENWSYYVGSFFTMSLCGFWHGASWNFILWGAGYGLLLIWEHTRLGKKMKRLPALVRLLYCQLLVLFGWVIFRSPSLGYALSFFKALVGLGQGNQLEFYPALYLNAETGFFLVVSIIAAFPALAWLTGVLEGWQSRLSTVACRMVRALRAAVEIICLCGLLLASLMTLAGGTYNPFIYFRF